MRFECPHCQQPLETETLYKGSATKCPQCGGDLTIPSAPEGGANRPGEPSPTPSEPADDFREDFTAARQILQQNLDKESKTLREALTEKGVDPADLDGIPPDGDGARAGAKLPSEARTPPRSPRPGPSPVPGLLTDSAHRKYEVGNTVAKGGMGAILDVKDVNTRRHVAMKIMLQPDQADREDTLRFVHEAQVLAQLEHPGIVPLYELSADASGSPYYTMKFVKGRTLKDILGKIKDGDKKTLEEYPLLRLLNVFQRVCDAIAFAHSKRVIHRDLKPENIMVGEYGEVLVMDWGLAKVLGTRSSSFAKAHSYAREVTVDKVEDRRGAGQKTADTRKTTFRVDSVRTNHADEDPLKTLDGAIMGTPQYMAPEQAMGEMDKINDCTDIYALGAILYTILTLRPPITGKNLTEILQKVTTGNIPAPTSYQAAVDSMESKWKKSSSPSQISNPQSPFSLPHLPGKRIPSSLAAVAMKALSLKPGDRYPYVKFLQRDIEAYQNGFATSAEQAGVLKQLTLLVKRNKGISVSVGIAAVLLAAATMAYVIRVQAGERRANRALAKFEAEQKQRLGERYTAAPALYDSAKMLIEKGDFRKAEGLLELAREYNPGYAPTAHLLAVLLMKEGKAGQAVDLLEQKAVQEAPGTKRLLNVAQQALKGGQASLSDLATWAGGQELPTLALQFSRSGQEQFEIYKAKILKLWPSAQFTMATDGALALNLQTAAQELRSLEPLRGIPLTKLDLSACRIIQDISPLEGMPMTSLNADRTGIRDLSPLKGMRLTYLNLGITPVEDISPLKGMPLTCLHLGVTRVSDLGPLKGMPLTYLYLNSSQVNDLSPLQGMPLTHLNISVTRVNDLSPLQGMPLKELLATQTEVSDLTPLKGMPLATLHVGNTRVSDLDPLKGLPLTVLYVGTSAVHDLTPLRGMVLSTLCLDHTAVSDLTPLEGMPLKCLLIPPGNITNGWDVIRGMKSLVELSEGGVHRTPTEFFKKLDAGGFNKQ